MVCDHPTPKQITPKLQNRVITRGVAKSVCHRDRRSLPNRQLYRLCRTDFGSPTTKQTKPDYIPCHPGQAGVLAKARSGLMRWIDPGSSLLETITPTLKQTTPDYKAVSSRASLLDPGSSLLGMSIERYRGAMNTRQNDLSVNPCNPFHPYDAWHANLIRID